MRFWIQYSLIPLLGGVNSLAFRIGVGVVSIDEIDK
jgi:hypothetical protein